MQIQQDYFIQKLLSLEKGRAKIPDVRKKRTWYLKKLTDAKLVKYIRRGNNHAFDVLIKRHEAKLKEIIRNNLFDKSMVEDVLNDVWEQAIPQIRGASPQTPLQRRGERSSIYREDGRFYGWLSTMAFRHSITLNRKKIHAPELMEELTDLPEEENLHELSEEAGQTLAEAKKIISTLKERDREIIRMHYEEGLTFEKIAGKMKLNRNSVKEWHSRSIKRVRQLLAKSKEKSEIRFHF